jgi:hypothetical protein
MATRKSRSNVIRFLPVDPRPCDQIPGGAVLGKVGCPSFEEPIGWIVRSPGEIPPGESTFTKPPVAWHFLPTCGIEPVLSGFTDQGALQNAVRQQYGGFYDRLPRNSRKRVATGDDCEIDGMILKWCGMIDFWDEHELSDDYSVTNDVLDDCDSADYWTREWYGGGPGLSGVWYDVYTLNPSLFIRQVRMKSQALLAEKLAKPPPPPKRRRSSKPKKTAPEELPPAHTDT